MNIIKSKIKNSSLTVNTLVILSFIILSIFNIASIYYLHKIHMVGLDMTFHWQRINELIQNPNLPTFATHMFSGNGSAVMTMYPYLFLYLTAFIAHFIKSIILCSFIVFGINTFITLTVSYWSSLSFNHNHLLSFIFSIVYSITPYIIIQNISCFYIGELYAFIFMPLVIFGFLNYLKHNNWVMLSIGMTCIIYSSVITAAIIPFFLLLWLIINFKAINKIKIFNIIKAIGLTILSSALFLLPAIKLFLFNKLNTPSGNKIMTMTFNDFVINPLNNLFDAGYNGLFSVYLPISLLIGLLIFRKFPKLIKQSYVLSLLILFIASNFFPWFLFNKTPLNSIQYTGRLLIIPKVLLTYCLAIFITRILRHHNLFIAFIGLLFIVLSIQVTSANSIFHETLKKPLATQQIITDPKYQTDKVHHNSAYDYYPKKSLKYKNEILNDKGFTRTKQVPFKLLNNGSFSVTTNHSLQDLTLPFLSYNQIRYKGYLDHHPVKLSSTHNQLLMIKHLNKGKHNIKISVINSKSVILSRILTLLSLIIYVLLFIKRLNKHN